MTGERGPVGSCCKHRATPLLQPSPPGAILEYQTAGTEGTWGAPSPAVAVQAVQAAGTEAVRGCKPIITECKS